MIQRRGNIFSTPVVSKEGLAWLMQFLWVSCESSRHRSKQYVGRQQDISFQFPWPLFIAFKHKADLPFSPPNLPVCSVIQKQTGSSRPRSRRRRFEKHHRIADKSYGKTNHKMGSK